MPGVKRRIDHLDVNLNDQVVYVAALGNNTLEAVDLHTGKVIHSIPGLDEPQGVGYIPQTGEIFVAKEAVCRLWRRRHCRYRCRHP